MFAFFVSMSPLHFFLSPKNPLQKAHQKRQVAAVLFGWVVATVPFFSGMEVEPSSIGVECELTLNEGEGSVAWV